MHDFERGQEVAEEEDEEGERQHEHLPFSAFLVAGELEQRDGIVELPELERGRQALLTHQAPLASHVESQGDAQAPHPTLGINYPRH